MAPYTHQIILFDLGGVLVEVDSVAALQQVLGQQLSWKRCGSVGSQPLPG